MINTVAVWLCKCGVRVKVVAETDRNKPTAKVFAACPTCGDQQEIYAHRIISITVEQVERLVN